MTDTTIEFSGTHGDDRTPDHLRGVYDRVMYEPDRAADSFWETDAAPTERFATQAPRDVVDVAIIGGGYTGLSAAYHLTNHHGRSVCVLEAGAVGRGASGRNGGFCNVSTIQPPATIAKRFGLEAAKDYFQTSHRGVEYVRDLVNELDLDVSPQHGGTLELAHKPSAFRGLKEKQALLRSAFGVHSELLSSDEVAARAFDTSHQHGALRSPDGFCLNPLRYARELADAAHRSGAHIVEHSPVLFLEKSGEVHRLHTANADVRARNVIVATNGYTPERLHEQFTHRLMPVISHIVTTRPLSPEELEAHQWQTQWGVSTTEGAHHYFRVLPDRRLLFGGPGDFTGKPEDAESSTGRLKRAIGRFFPAWSEIELTHSWRGLVCTSQKFAPSVGTVSGDATILYGLAYHGNGVAAATWTGRKLAVVAAKEKPIEDAFPNLMLGLKGKFPMPSLRPWYLRAAMAARTLGD